MALRSRVWVFWGSGFGAFGVQGSGFRVQGFRGLGLWFRVSGALGFSRKHLWSLNNQLACSVRRTLEWLSEEVQS